MVQAGWSGGGHAGDRRRATGRHHHRRGRASGSCIGQRVTLRPRSVDPRQQRSGRQRAASSLRCAPLLARAALLPFHGDGTSRSTWLSPLPNKRAIPQLRARPCAHLLHPVNLRAQVCPQHHARRRLHPKRRSRRQFPRHRTTPTRPWLPRCSPPGPAIQPWWSPRRPVPARPGWSFTWPSSSTGGRLTVAIANPDLGACGCRMPPIGQPPSGRRWPCSAPVIPIDRWTFIPRLVT